ncbi:hypothetical protein J2Z21_003701 [Streptomyces griseochromogenes]|uniref:Uncharacterized protein n=1 Tax=Streptomyces griseochromogenes TaxID=68214 RepID=A0A1B1AP27_9ACTN|nr:hypothetical protein [Streptomyces griseochromogenes]ANP48311.1 hypothetical protein AVL59_00840 [Streptomyces griseochromogenes]MBP2050751.1 hypothetical protein [Streptomyces griseochromogenes]
MPGTVLLLAASPLGRGCLVDAAGVLPVLAAVAPAVLSGTDTANVVELADPLEPQAVLTRLRAAAAAPGPLTVYVVGQLQLDRRQHLPHLALARTTPATVRYTALPWHWIREELRLRSASDTALVVDLHADAETWRHLAERPLDCGRTAAVYGRVAPGAGGRRGVAEPSYMKAVATLLRSGHRPPLAQLHEQALARIAESSAGRDLVLAGPGGYAPGPPYRPERPRPQVPDGLGHAAAVRPQVPDGIGYAAAVRPQMPDGIGYAGVSAQVPDGLGHVAVRPQVPDGPGAVDPHADISAAVQAGRHADAEVLAARHEQAAMRAHGAASGEALHWAEVRADLAMFAGDSVRSCRAWLGVAGVRLTAGQAVDAPAVEAAVDRAHHQWTCIKDAARARELGPALAELRLRVPGRRQGALEDVQRQLRQLQAAR